MDKNMNKFLASVLSKTEINDDQAAAIQDILFPAEDETPQAQVKAAKEMSLAYEKFNLKYEEAAAKRAAASAAKNAKPMTEEEINELVEMGM